MKIPISALLYSDEDKLLGRRASGSGPISSVEYNRKLMLVHNIDLSLGVIIGKTSVDHIGASARALRCAGFIDLALRASRAVTPDQSSYPRILTTGVAYPR